MIVLKKILVITLLVTLLLAFAACAGPDAGNGKGEVIGTVNGAEIYRDEYDYYFDNYFQSYYSNYYTYFLYYMNIDLMDEESAKDTLASLEQYAWDMVVKSELIKQTAANDYQITYEDKYLKDVLTWGAYDSIIVNDIYSQLYGKVQEQMLAEISVSDEDVQAKYDEDPSAWDARKTSHILIKCDVEDEAARTEAYAKAVDIINQLNGGADFAELAKEYSDDGSAENGGVIDTFFNVSGKDVAGDTSLYPEYVAAAFTLANVGDYSLEPVQSSAGYHIIQLDEKREGFEASKAVIAETMKSVSDEDVSAKLNEIIEAAKAEAEIKQQITFKYYDPNAAETGEEGEQATDGNVTDDNAEGGQATDDNAAGDNAEGGADSGTGADGADEAQGE